MSAFFFRSAKASQVQTNEDDDVGMPLQNEAVNGVEWTSLPKSKDIKSEKNLWEYVSVFKINFLFTLLFGFVEMVEFSMLVAVNSHSWIEK